MKSSGIGGQAVLEGVMMKNKEKYAIAVRKPDNEIAVEISEYKGISDRISFFKLPIFRGMAAFADSMYIGTKALTFSSSFFEEEEEREKEKKKGKKSSDGFFTFLTFFLSIAVAVGIFILLPLFLSNLISDKIDSVIILGIIEGVIRVALFVGYIVAISQMKDIKRFFQYHGAEHKAINCIEHGHELTVSNVRRQSKEHKRCGTSFMLFVMLVSIVLFMFIQTDTVALRYILRILLIPIISGISYEIIRLAGNSDNVVINIISKPGLWMQGLTTKEPDDKMIEVAIASVEAVFDWREYLEKNGKKAGKKKKASASKNSVQSDKGKSSQKEKSHDVAAAKPFVSEQKKTQANNKKQIKSHTHVTSAQEETAVTVEDDLAVLDKNLFEKQAVEEKSSQVVEKIKKHEPEQIISSTQIDASLEPDDSEEEDAILKALDRYLFFEKDDK